MGGQFFESPGRLWHGDHLWPHARRDCLAAAAPAPGAAGAGCRRRQLTNPGVKNRAPAKNDQQPSISWRPGSRPASSSRGPTEGAEALALDQPPADEAHDDEHRDRVADPERATDLNERMALDEGDDQEQEDERRKHGNQVTVPSVRAT